MYALSIGKPVSGAVAFNDGQNVIITGNATLNWVDTGFFMVGRGVSGQTPDRDAVTTVTIQDATISTANPSTPSTSYGFNVSGAAGDDDVTNNGVLYIKNSTVQNDYVLDRNLIDISDESDVTFNTMYVYGRDSSDSKSGHDEVAYLNIHDTSTLTVKKDNGFVHGNNGGGVLNVMDSSSFKYEYGTWTIGAKGIVNLTDEATFTATNTAITNNGAIILTAGNTFTAKSISGTGTITIDAADLAANTTKKVIDLSQTAELANVALTDESIAAGVRLVKGADGDVVVHNISAANLYVNAAWATGYSVGDKINIGTTEAPVYVYYGINAFSRMEDVTDKIATDGSDTTVHILSNLTPAASLDFSYGNGKVSFVKDGDESVSVAFANTGDFAFVQGTEATITIGEGVTFSTYNNQSDFAVYYGPSLSVYGTISGGANYGALYVYDGDHKVHTTGTIGTGRIHMWDTNLTIYGIEGEGADLKRRYDADVAVADRSTDAQAHVNFLFLSSGTFTASDTYITVGNLTTGGDGHGIYDTNKGTAQSSNASIFNLTNTKVETYRIALSKTNTQFNATGSVINVTGAFSNAGSITLSNGATLDATIAAVNSGEIALDVTSTITGTTLDNASGTIKIDATGLAANSIAKVIDLDQSSALSNVTLNAGETGAKLVLGSDGDVVIHNISVDNVYVNTDWATGYSVGDEIVLADSTKVYYGINAFSNVDESFAYLSNGTNQTTKLADLEEIGFATGSYTGGYIYADKDVSLKPMDTANGSVATFTNAVYLAHAVTQQAVAGKDYYVLLDDNGEEITTDNKYSTLPTFTIEQGLTIELGNDTFRAGQNVDDDSDAAKRTQSAANIVVNGTLGGRLYLASYSSALISETGVKRKATSESDLIRESATLTVKGTANAQTIAAAAQKTNAELYGEAQYGAAYVQVAGGTVSLDKTVAAVDAWFTMYDRGTGETRMKNGDALFSVNASYFRVNGWLGQNALSSSISVTNKSLVEVGSYLCNLGTGNTITIEDSTVNVTDYVQNDAEITLADGGALNADSLTSSGTISVDATSSIKTTGAFENSGAITITVGGTIKADTFTNGGTITIDATGITEYADVITVNNGSAQMGGTIELIKDDGSKLELIKHANGSVSVGVVGEDIYFNSAWSTVEDGTAIPVDGGTKTVHKGVDAFAALDDAATTAGKTLHFVSAASTTAAVNGMFDGSELVKAQDAAADVTVSLSGASFVQQKGDLTIGSGVTFAATKLIHRNITEETTITVEGTFQSVTNAYLYVGVMNVTATGKLTGDDVSLNGGKDGTYVLNVVTGDGVTEQVDVTSLSIGGAATANFTNTIVSAASLSVTAATGVVNASNTTINGNVSNAGVVNVSNTTINGDVENKGTINVAANKALSLSGAVDNKGKINLADGSTLNTAGATFTNKSAGEITLNGTLSKVIGSATNEGAINVGTSTLIFLGDGNKLTNAAGGNVSISVNGLLSAASLENNGTIELSGASKLAAGTITGTGTLKFDGATINDAIEAAGNKGVFTGTNAINADLNFTKNNTSGAYDQGYTTHSIVASQVKVTNATLTAKNYYIGNDVKGGVTDTLILDNSTITSPAPQDNTALYVRGSGVVQANGASIIGTKNGIFNIMDYGAVTLIGGDTEATRTKAYFDGFVVYGVDYDEPNNTEYSSAAFTATNADITVRGTLDSSVCNQYTIGGLTTAVLVGGKDGKGDGAMTLTSSTFTVNTNFAIGFVKAGTVNVNDGSTLTVSGTIGIGLADGTGALNIDAVSTVTANAITFGDNGSIKLTIDAAALTEAFYTLIDITGTDALDTTKITVNGEAFADGATYDDYTLKLWDGDVMLFQTPVKDTTTLYVSESYTGYYGQKVAEDKYFLINAFNNLVDAFDSRKDDTVAVNLDAVSSIASTGDKEWVISQDTTISGNNAATVELAGTDFRFYANDEDAEHIKTLTIEEDVKINLNGTNGKTATFYIGRNSGEFAGMDATINGTLNVDQFYSSYGSQVTMTGKLATQGALMMHGATNEANASKVIQRNGVVVFDGTGKGYSADDLQVNVKSYLSVFGGDMTFKNTFAKVATTIRLYNYKDIAEGPRSLTLDGANVTAKTLSVEDYGMVTLTNGSTLNLTNNASVIASCSISITDSTLNTVGTLESTGTITVSGTSLLTIGALTGTITVNADADLTGSVVGGTGDIAVSDAVTLKLDGKTDVTSFGAVTNAGTIDIEGALVNLGAITNNGTINIDGDLVNLGAINNAADINMTWQDLLTFSGYEGAGLINIDMTDYNGVEVDTKVLDCKGEAAMDYQAMTGFGTDDFERYFSVKDNDLYLKGGVSDTVYVHDGMSIADAVEMAIEKSAIRIVVENGTFSDSADFGPVLGKNDKFSGYIVEINDGTFDDSATRITGGAVATLDSKKTYLTTEGDRSVTINGGEFNGVVVGGDRLTSLGHLLHGDEEEGSGPYSLNLEINGGKFNKNVAGGMMLDLKATTGEVIQYGDINLTIKGGTFAKFIYGGNVSSSKTYSSQTLVNGDITVTIDTTAGETISINSLYAGSYGDGRVDGSTKVVLTGDGQYLSVADQLWGGCTGDVYLVSETGTKTAESKVFRTRTLSFEGFTGDLNVKSIKMFSDVKFDAESDVDFTNFRGTMAEVNNWEIAFGSENTGAFNNDFAGDSLTLTGLSGALEEPWVIFGNTSMFKNITEEGAGFAKINGSDAVLSDNLLEGEICGYDLGSYTLAFTEASDTTSAQMVLRNAIA